MKQRIILVVTGLIATTLMGCAHGLMRGSVAMKVSDTEAHVCMDKSEAKVGDRVTLFRNNCPAKGVGGGGTCTKVELGQGTVTEILNDHYSVVKFDPGVKFSEGAFVEKR
ncbi:MAG: hypothetical protein A4S09_15190 [Proteobacteria bacterium SG_bin7]|nr:MAG: hypothetical protein A4S09_15190 [Proteobacteria bacterium SG_bin7]